MPTGVAIALPDGYVALVHPRSGLAARHGLSIVNTPGTVDAGYRGEIKVMLINHDPREPIELRRGDRIAQLVIQRVERARFVEVGELPDSVARRRGLRFYRRLRSVLTVARPRDRGVVREVPSQVRRARRARTRRRPRRRAAPRPTTARGGGPVRRRRPARRRRRAGRPRLAADPRPSRAASCGSRSTRRPARCRPCSWPARTARSSCARSPRPATATCGARCARRSRPTCAQRGGTATEREGRFGPELVCQLTVQPRGRPHRAPSRRGSSASTARAGCCGPRCSAARRSTSTTSADWEDTITTVVVRRGDRRDAGRRRAARRAARATRVASTHRRPRLDACPRRAGCDAASAGGRTPPTSTPATCARRYADDGPATRSREAPDRERVRLRGTLRTVTLRPRGGVPALEAELFDGTGVITVVWLGRRRIAGIAPGPVDGDPGPDRPARRPADHVQPALRADPVTDADREPAPSRRGRRAPRRRPVEAVVRAQLAQGARRPPRHDRGGGADHRSSRCCG